MQFFIHLLFILTGITIIYFSISSVYLVLKEKYWYQRKIQKISLYILYFIIGLVGIFYIIFPFQFL